MTPQKMQELSGSIEMYGRKIHIIDGHEVIHSDIIGDYSSRLYITDFKPLPEGGCHTFIYGHNQPMRIVFQTDKMNTIHQVKRLIPVLLETIRRSPILGYLYIRRNWPSYVDFIHHSMRDVFTDVRFYNQPVREIHRAMSDKGIDKIRDIVCAIAEYDNQYRYRIQDVLAEMNKEELMNTPIKEFKRIIKVYSSRETMNGNLLESKVGKGATTFLMIYLFMNRKLLDKIRSVLIDISQREVSFSVEDKYWVSRETMYKYEIH